jgi:hypothetical protein
LYIAYFDESGDDGFPKYSSKLFVHSKLSKTKKAIKKHHLRRIRVFSGSSIYYHLRSQSSIDIVDDF